MSRWIRVYPSHDSEGLWDVEGRRSIDPKTLPISDALKVRIAEWMDRFLYEGVRGSTEALDAFAADGLAVARALKTELPACVVSYYDLAAEARNTEDDFPRADHPDPWDYEIE